MDKANANAKGSLRKFVMIMVSLGICLVLLWVAFFLLTMRNVKENARVQAEGESEAILSRIEDELQTIDETLYVLSHYEPLISMLNTEDKQEFYDRGGSLSKSAEDLIGLDNPAGNVVLFQNNGTFYRLRGTMPNAAMIRIASILNQEGKNSFHITTNDMTYIGSVQKVFDEGKDIGYVVLLMEKTRLEYILSDYSEIDFIGIALTSGDHILCANRELKIEDLEKIKADSLIYKERAIGLTDMSLVVYADESISEKLKDYFLIALPVTIVILCSVMAFFIHYSKKKMLEPHEREMFETKMKAQQAEIEKERTLMKMLKKQINSHFTVNTMNSVRALIHRGDPETASRMCDEMSCLLRYANAPEEYISLMEEFYVLEQYVEIMKVRYPDRFIYEAEIDDDFAEIRIPRMLLQPIIENAILYGAVQKHNDQEENAAQKTKIEVTVQKSDCLLICVKDNGKGISEEKLEYIRSGQYVDGIKGVALINIQKRIQIAYGEEYGIRIESEPGKGTSVFLKLRL